MTGWGTLGQEFSSTVVSITVVELGMLSVAKPADVFDRDEEWEDLAEFAGS